MTLRNFLFADKAPQKFYRHIAFWIASCLPFILMGVIGLYTKHYWGGVGAFLAGQLERLPKLAVDIAFTYVVVYRFLPQYYRTKKLSVLIWKSLALAFIAFIAKAVIWYSQVHLFYKEPERLYLNFWFVITDFFNDGPLMRCVIFLFCKMLKNYYQKSEEKIAILRENATAELQLLKAQVHPHFLFNTLNNIYSFSLQRSPLAASLVEKLSDTLRYMITECEASLVPLGKELKMLKDYIGLESVRYGSRLEVTIQVKGEPEGKMIAPLLLIPLVENSFKHGTSQMLEQPWISLTINIHDTFLEFRLINSKPVRKGPQEKRNGIGLGNVRKRINLLYPSQHSFNVKSSLETYEVSLQVPLHTLKSEIVENAMPEKFKKLKLA